MYLGQVAAVKAAVQEKRGATSAKISAAAAAATDLMGASANKMPLLCVFSCVAC